MYHLCFNSIYLYIHNVCISANSRLQKSASIGYMSDFMSLILIKFTHSSTIETLWRYKDRWHQNLVLLGCVYLLNRKGMLRTVLISNTTTGLCYCCCCCCCLFVLLLFILMVIIPGFSLSQYVQNS